MQRTKQVPGSSPMVLCSSAAVIPRGLGISFFPMLTTGEVKLSSQWNRGAGVTSDYAWHEQWWLTGGVTELKGAVELVLASGR